ncbi:uncharacterized protein V1516DRAFT_684721 [Lipomyces oligophaga]|uniref:uncharacterized protein n=1 Tax=Lipomyces oligophaga TaxID=45792 RepID=UPI0034CF4C4E
MTEERMPEGTEKQTVNDNRRGRKRMCKRYKEKGKKKRKVMKPDCATNGRDLAGVLRVGIPSVVGSKESVDGDAVGAGITVSVGGAVLLSAVSGQDGQTEQYSRSSDEPGWPAVVLALAFCICAVFCSLRTVKKPNGRLAKHPGAS